MFRGRRSSSAASGRYDPTIYAAATQSSVDPSLSAAAAAAALRSAASTPTPGVGEIQTKRMMRRGSTASNASNTGSARPGGGLQRRTSSGSMTERTFRAQSPGPGNRSRPGSAAGWTPPVPAMPKNIPNVSQKLQQRTPSTDPPMTRIKSPEPRVSQRSGSADNNAKSPAAARRGSVRAPSLSRVPEGQERDGPINFSRPMSPEGRPASRQLARISEPTDEYSDGGTPGRATSTNRLSIQAQVKIAARERQQALARGLPPPTVKPMTPAALAALTAGNRPASSAGQRISSRPPSAQGRPITNSVRPASAQGTSFRPASAQGRPITEAVRAPASPASAQGRTATATAAARPASAMAMRTTSSSQVGQTPLSSTVMHAGLPEPNPQPTWTSRPVSGTRQRTRSSTGPSNPSQEQIRGFQEQAALGMARPRPQMPSSPPSASRTVTQNANVGLARTNSSAGTTGAGIAALAAAGVSSQARSVSQPKLTAPGGSRVPSASPARSAHFADLPVPGVRHQPPPRSVSPSKPSLRGYSPAESARIPTNASSVSLISEDGMKKRRAKVGFSEVPTVLGETPRQPTFANNDGVPSFPDDLSAGMGSRPALPSFDSVRSRKEGQFSTIADGAYQSSRGAPSTGSSVPSFGSVNTSSLPIGDVISRMNASATSYHATPTGVNGIPQGTRAEDEPYSAMLDRIDASTNGTREEPGHSDLPVHAISKPPTVNGTGYDNDAIMSPQSVLSRIFGGPPQQSQSSSVPAISVLPASPTLDQSQSSFTRNGGALEAFHPGENTHVESDASSYYDETPRPAYSHEAVEEEEELDEHHAGTGEPAGYASLDAIVESPHAEEPSGGSKLGSTMASVGGGIVGAGGVPMVSPLGSKSPEEDWAKIKAYWSGLSEQRKQQLEGGGQPTNDLVPQRGVQENQQYQPQNQGYAQAQNNGQSRNIPQGQYPQPNQNQYAQGQTPQGQHAQGEYAQGQPPQQRQPVKGPIKSAMKPGTNRVDGPINPNPVPLPPWPDNEYQQSARSSRPSSLRTSLRPGNERNDSNDSTQPRKGMRMSMRGNEEAVEHVKPTDNQRMTAQRAAGGLAAQRMAETAASGDRRAPGPSDAAVALARQQMQKMALQRTKSNDSDSDSSFKRNKKRRDKENEGRYSMKRSMRDSAQADARANSPPPGRNNQFGVPSPSLAESPNKKSILGAFRTNSNDSNGPPKEQRGFAGFGRKAKPSAKTEQPAQSNPAAFQSRFNDSDDEDVGRPTPFTRSRLAGDSDDEGETNASSAQRQTNLAPVRGIPRPAGHQSGNSTDLSDEIAEGRALHAGTMRGNHANDSAVFDSPSAADKKSHGLRGMFTMNKNRRGGSVDNTNAVNASQQQANGDVVSSPGAGNKTTNGGGIGILRRLSTSQSNQAHASPSSAPVTPRKYVTTGPGTANEWPLLPPPIPESYGNEYPGAASRDGGGGGGGGGDVLTTRPQLGTPKGSLRDVGAASGGGAAAGAAAAGGAAAAAGGVGGAERPQRPTIMSRKSGKKKRFQGLRRVLGMSD